MPAPSTRNQFLELVRESGLLTDQQINVRTQNAVTPLPEDLREAAALFVREGLLTTFQAQRLLWGQFRGFLIGNYRVLDQIGKGGMGNVYLCEHRSLHRRVAIKVLPPDKAGDPETVERFYREGRAVAALNHPNIVRAYDIDHEGNLHFLVMEYVEGTTLDKVLEREGRLAPGRAADYVRQAAVGLQHVHAAGLVHRDIKPSNLMLVSGGGVSGHHSPTVKLLDLGLARFFSSVEKESLSPHSDHGTIMGTPDYIAPEQCVNSHNVDIRADIYSLGATFYHMLAGRPPFDDVPVAQKLIMHQMSDPTPIRQICPEAPADLTRIIDRMLIKSPARRFQTPGEVAAALAPFCPVADEKSPRPSTGRRAPEQIADANKGIAFPGLPAPESISLGEPAPDTDTGDGQTSIFAWTDLTREDAVYNPDADPTLLPSGGGLPVSGSAPASNRRQSAAQSHRRRRLLLIAGTVLALGGVAAWWLTHRGDDDGGPDAPGNIGAGHGDSAAPGPRSAPVLVQFGSGAGREFPSLREAVAQARPNSKLILQGDIAEAVTLEGSVGRDIIIEPAAGRIVHWRPPPNLKDGQPLLQIVGVSGLHVKGLHFDGQKRVHDLISLTGRCAATTLEALQLSDFRHSAVTLRTCRGDAGKPANLSKLRILGNIPPSPLQARSETGQDGVRFAAGATAPAYTADGDSPANQQHIAIQNCRFEGPLRSAINLADSVGNVEISQNRFYQVTTGLLYRQAEPPQRRDLELKGNTFCEVETALSFEALPPADASNWIFVQNNLFVKTARVAGVEGFTGEPAQVTAQWIWAKEANGFEAAAPGTVYFRKAFPVGEDVRGPAVLSVASREAFTVWLNGEVVAKATPTTERVYAFDVSKRLRAGTNLLAVEAVHNNNGAAGLLAEIRHAMMTARRDSPAGPNKASILLATDDSWKMARNPADGWQHPDFSDAAWEPVKVLGAFGPSPWHPLWDIEIVRRFPEQGGRLLDMAEQVVTAAGAVDLRTPELRAALTEWASGWHNKLTAQWSAWTALKPDRAISAGDATLTILDDFSVLASGKNPPNDTYTVTLPCSSPRITGICLEALTDPSLGNQSVGRGWGGNFVLTRVEVEAATAEKTTPTPLTIATSQANFAQKGFAIANVINAASNVGWAVQGDSQRLNRMAVFLFPQALSAGPGTVLTVRLKCESKEDNHVIGRFRLFVTSADKPPLPEDNPLPADVKAILLNDLDKRSSPAARRLAEYFRATTALLDTPRKQLADRLREQEQMWSPFRGPAGNFRDGESRDGYPLLKPTWCRVNLPTDRSSDAQFLRYESNSFLRTAGAGNSPVGVPPQ